MSAETLSLPTGWFVAGSNPRHYLAGVDRTSGHDSSASGTVVARIERPEGFGTLMQECSAASYRGKRLQLSGYLKAAGVTGWAGMWLRIDGPDSERRSLGFDNMQERPLRGSCDWTRHAIVLDVPESSHALAFGVLLAGAGQVCIDDLQFAVVEATIPVTGHRPEDQPHPVNLDFEQLP